MVGPGRPRRGQHRLTAERVNDAGLAECAAELRPGRHIGLTAGRLGTHICRQDSQALARRLNTSSLPTMPGTHGGAE